MDHESIVTEVDAETLHEFICFCNNLRLTISQVMLIMARELIQKGNPEDAADFLRELADVIERGDIREVLYTDL